jgi:hypothetical protein
VVVDGGAGPVWFDDREFDWMLAHPELNPGIVFLNGRIYAGGTQVGTYHHFSDFDTMIGMAGDLAAYGLRREAGEMAWWAANGAAGGLAGVLSGGIATKSLSVTGRIAPLKYGKAAGKLARQMAARGWTDNMIREAVAAGEQVQTINKATGNLAIRYIHPGTGQSIVIDTVTKEIIHVGGPGFLY